MMVDTIYTSGYSTQYIMETAQGTLREHEMGGRRPTSQEAHSISKSWYQSALWGAEKYNTDRGPDPALVSTQVKWGRRQH